MERPMKCRTVKNSPWDPDETEIFLQICEKYNNGWKLISDKFSEVTGKNYNGNQCMNRWKQLNAKRGPWTKGEDEILTNCVANNLKWPDIAKMIPGRSSKQCRERWKTGVQPTIDRSEFREDEDRVILLERLAKKGWSVIAKSLPGRVDNAIKNRYNTMILPIVRKLHPENLEIYAEGDIPQILDNLRSTKTPNRKTPKRGVLRDLTNQNQNNGSPNSQSTTSKKRSRHSFDLNFDSPQPTKIQLQCETPQPFGDDDPGFFDFPDIHQHENIPITLSSFCSPLPPSPLSPFPSPLLNDI